MIGGQSKMQLRAKNHEIWKIGKIWGISNWSLENSIENDSWPKKNAVEGQEARDLENWKKKNRRNLKQSGFFIRFFIRFLYSMKK